MYLLQKRSDIYVKDFYFPPISSGSFVGHFRSYGQMS